MLKEEYDTVIQYFRDYNARYVLSNKIKTNIKLEGIDRPDFIERLANSKEYYNIRKLDDVSGWIDDILGYSLAVDFNSFTNIANDINLGKWLLIMPFEDRPYTHLTLSNYTSNEIIEMFDDPVAKEYLSLFDGDIGAIYYNKTVLKELEDKFDVIITIDYSLT